MSAAILYFRFNPSDRVWIEGKAYRPSLREEPGHLFLSEDDPGIQRLFTHAELDALVLAGEVRIQRNAFRPKAMLERAGNEIELLGNLPEKDRAQVGRRFLYVERFIQMEANGEATRSDASMKRAIGLIHAEIRNAELASAAKLGKNDEPARARADKEYQDHIPPSPRTLRRSLKIFQGSEGQVTSLRKGWRRCGDRISQRHPSEVRDLVENIAAQFGAGDGSGVDDKDAEKRSSVRTLHWKLKAKLDVINDRRKAAGLEPYRAPSYRFLLTEVKELHALDTLASRYGPPTAEAQMAAAANGIMATRPLERVEIDEWKIDLYTVFKHCGFLDDLSADEVKDLRRQRFWLCAVIDTVTRVILGMKIGKKVGVQLALDTIEMAISPKTPYARIARSVSNWLQAGAFEQLAHDQATWFMSLDFRIPLLDLGSEILAPPAGKARLRPKIERFFRTAKDALAFFTGKTFENVVVKGDYDPVVRASLTVPELCEVLVRWTVEKYHNKPHKGLNGQTPANAWNRLTKKYGVMPPPHPHDLRAIFGVRVNGLTLSTKGIEFCGLFYNCIELQEYFQKFGRTQADIKVNHRDINCISVELEDNCWLAAPCMRPAMKHVPLEVWIATQQALKRQYKEEAEASEDIINEYVLDMMKFAADAEQRTGLVSTRPTSDQLMQLHKNVSMSFQFLRPDIGPSPLKGNLLDHAIISPRAPLKAPPPNEKPSRILK